MILSSGPRQNRYKCRTFHKLLILLHHKLSDVTEEHKNCHNDFLFTSLWFDIDVHKFRIWRHNSVLVLILNAWLFKCIFVTMYFLIVPLNITMNQPQIIKRMFCPNHRIRKSKLCGIQCLLVYNIFKEYSLECACFIFVKLVVFKHN